MSAPGLDALYDRFSFSVLPRLGEMVAKDGESYRYLAESNPPLSGAHRVREDDRGGGPSRA